MADNQRLRKRIIELEQENARLKGLGEPLLPESKSPTLESHKSLTEEEKEYMRPLLNQYCNISLREQSGVAMVKDICGKESQCTCDPTLLLSGEEWGKIFDDKPIIKDDYILCYICV